MLYCIIEENISMSGIRTIQDSVR